MKSQKNSAMYPFNFLNLELFESVDGKKTEENSYKLSTNANLVHWFSAKRREEREKERCLAVATRGKIDLQYSHQHPNHISYQYLEALR